MFSLIKKDPNEILDLIDNAISHNDIKSNKELKILFEMKIEEIHSSNVEKWKYLINKVEIKENPTPLELSWHIINENVNKRMKTSPNYYKEFEINGVSWVYSGMKEEMDKLDHDSLLKEHDKTMLFNLNTLKLDIEPYEREDEKYNPKPDNISRNYLFTNENISKEDFLIQIPLKKPKKLEPAEIDKLFYDLLLYINKQQSGKLLLFEELSRGLSDQINSNSIFTKFVFKTTKEILVPNYPLV